MTLAQRRIEDQDPETSSPALTTSDGASARVEPTAAGEVLRVRDRGGRLLFEYDAEAGRGTLIVPDGDLRLCAPRGSIELDAAHGIRAVAGGEIALEGPTVRVRAEESDLSLGDVRATAGALHAAVDRAELAFGTVLRSAVRAIEQAENFYQRVTELCDIKAGRLRALVKQGVWVKGDDVTLLADKDVRVDGEHINLG
jgi:hypothetical protein